MYSEIPQATTKKTVQRDIVKDKQQQNTIICSNNPKESKNEETDK